MYIDFSQLFHQSSKDLTAQGTVRIPLDTTMWPKEWKTVRYKEYPRFKRVSLSRARPRGDFFSVVSKRKTGRSFSGTPLSKETVSVLLRYSCGIVGRDDTHRRRAHPSGGALFPIEIYPVVFRGNTHVPAGVYHYNILDHALEVLWQRPFAHADIERLTPYHLWVRNASCMLVMTAVFARTQNKYGARGYRYVLVEAGHIGQNIYLISQALGLKCTGLGGVWDVELEKVLDIDGVTESVVYAIAVG